MEKLMRNAPGLIVFVVMALQTPRIAEFGNRIDVWIPFAIIFALFLTFTTFTLAFFQGRTSGYEITADKTDARAYAAQQKMKKIYDRIWFMSSFWLIVFVFIEGSINLAETMSNLPVEVTSADWKWFGALVYGVMPTIAAYAMGSLQALASKIPHGANKGAQIDRIFDAFMRRIENALNADASDANASTTHKTQDAPKAKRNADAYPRACPHCHEMQPNSNAYSAHMRWKHGPQSSQPIGFVAQPANKSTTTTSGVVANQPSNDVKKE